MGVSVVNALSQWLRADIYREGYHYCQQYSCGDPTTPVQKLEETDRCGTVIRFLPDRTVFDDDAEFQYDLLRTRFRELAYLNRGITITLKDHRDDKQDVFHFDGGIVSFVSYLNRNKQPLHPDPIYISACKGESSVEIAIQYNDGYNENIYTFANNIATVEGGVHLTGFKNGITRAINDYARKFNFLKQSDVNLTGEDVREGITSVISVKLTDPQFEGQTKTKLGNAEIRSVVEGALYDGITVYFEENPALARTVVSKCLLARRARAKRRGARGRRPSARVRWIRRPFRASLPTAANATRKNARSISSRATARAEAPNRAGTGISRPSCRFAERFSTSRKPVLTKCLQTTR